jgi:DNA-binding beta-propeller fold protein YncE
MTSHRRVGTFVTAALIAVLGIAAAALGAVGDITPQGCVDDTSSGSDACAQMTESLNLVRSVAVSPDGESVYAAGGGAITRFDRDPATGALTPQGCFDDDDNMAGVCAQDTDGLDGARAVAVSPDGASVYVATSNDDAIVRFDRDTDTGALTPQGCVDDDDSGTEDGCAQSTSGLGNAFELAVSPDGTSVYVVSTGDDAIVRFDRNTETDVGALTPQECVDDDETGTDTCGSETDGLGDVGAAAVSPDGTSVYAASSVDDAVVRFDRDTGTGILTPQGCVQDQVTGPEPDPCAGTAPGLDGAISVTVTPDDASVYVASANADAVVGFDRDTEADVGAIAFLTCVGGGSCGQDAPGFDLVRSVAVSPDGRTVYAAAEDSDAVLRLNRDVTDGSLPGPFEGAGHCVQDDEVPPGTSCTQDAEGLDGATSVAVSPDGASVYAAALDDDAVARFARETPPGPPPPPPGDGGGGVGGGDADPPETTITDGPKAKTKNKSATFEFTSDEPGSSFQCSLDDKAFEPCGSPEQLKAGKGKHSFDVRAIDPAGNTDPTPADQAWKVKKKRKR